MNFFLKQARYVKLSSFTTKRPRELFVPPPESSFVAPEMLLEEVRLHLRELAKLSYEGDGSDAV
jgi:hypothetical protein